MAAAMTRRAFCPGLTSSGEPGRISYCECDPAREHSCTFGCDAMERLCVPQHLRSWSRGRWADLLALGPPEPIVRLDASELDRRQDMRRDVPPVACRLGGVCVGGTL